jgi:hypothetical protein
MRKPKSFSAILGESWLDRQSNFCSLSDFARRTRPCAINLEKIPNREQWGRTRPLRTPQGRQRTVAERNVEQAKLALSNFMQAAQEAVSSPRKAN